MGDADIDELLQAYQKISDTFDDFTHLMRARVPYESWPPHCKIAGVNPDLLGPASGNLGCDAPGTPIDFNSHLRRLEPVPIPEPEKNIWDLLKEKGFDPTKALPTAMISRIEDIGRAQQRLKSILDDDLFDNLSKHNTYWHSKYEPESDKLDDLRRKLSCLSDNLWDLMTILQKDEEL